MKKQDMIEALRRFINQRSGIDFRNYWTGDYWNARSEARAAFMNDYRPMLRHGKHARVLLRSVELRDSITADNLVEASRAFCGRLQFKEGTKGVEIEYTTGQYFSTEYRCAACAVLARALWDFWIAEYKSADEAQRRAKREFGRAIANDWFN